MNDEISFLQPHQPEQPVEEFHPRILLVDDEPRMLSSLEELLKGRGYELTTASGGREGIAHMQRAQFDLLLLDLQMPDVNGHDVMDFVNESYQDLSVIVTSGASEIEAAIGAIRRGAYGYLRKPYSREELLKTVDNALQQRKLEAENQRIASRLERSERMYRYLVDGSPDIIYTLDARGNISFINDRVQHLLGFRRSELIGQHYSVLVHDGDLERANYIFNEGRSEFTHSRSVELRLNSKHEEDEPRTFSIELVLIHLSGDAPSSRAAPAGAKPMGIYGVARDITDRKRADAKIAYQAYHDILTELPNRALFNDRLGLALLQARRNESSLAVMFIDLDRFKMVNDTFGHGGGDGLLQQVASRLRSCLRRCDTLARIGGDEFTAILPELNSREDAALIAENLSSACACRLMCQASRCTCPPALVSPCIRTTAKRLMTWCAMPMWRCTT